MSAIIYTVDGTLRLLPVPRLSANDEDACLIERCVPDGAAVRVGQTIAAFEGGKAVGEIEAPEDGVIFWGMETGERGGVGAPFAVLCPPGTDRPTALTVFGAAPPPAPAVNPDKGFSASRFTPKARALMAAHQLSEERFAGQRLVTSAVVRATLAPSLPAHDAPPASPPRRNGNGRTAVVAAGPGAAQVLSILLEERGTEVIGLFDDDPSRIGREILGVRVAGGTDCLEAMAGIGDVDSVIVATPNWPDLNRRIHTLAERLGLGLANAIHPTAYLDRGARIGGGCYIGPFCYLGAETDVGSHCFLSSRTTFEHHNRVGDFVTTGPNVATSGMVVVESGVRFGAGIVVEPGLTIGAGAVLASGVVITVDVSAGERVKAPTSRRTGPGNDFRER